MTDKLLIERELLPCPFCGGQMTLKISRSNGHQVFGKHTKDCAFSDVSACMQEPSDCEWVADEIIKRWNTRAAPRQPEGREIAWRLRSDVAGCGLVRYMTDSKYQAQTPAIKQWYEPFRCQQCSDAQRANAELTDRNTKLCATINRMVAEGVLICDERDTLCQQLSERDAEIERGAIERSELRKQIAERDMEILAKDISECKALGDRNKAREQRDKLIELLLDARHFCQRAPSLLPKIDAALAEVNK